MSMTAEIIHCPCGRALECARTDVLESLTCPVCGEEVELDLRVNERRCRGYLTIVAGPDRCGEDLMLPLGRPLRVGSATNNWLYLPDEHVAAVHCTLLLEHSGVMTVTVGGDSHSGQPFRAEVKPQQTLRIGPFSMRYTIRPVSDPNSSSVFHAKLAAAAKPRSGEIPVRVPVMQAVTEVNPFVHNLTSQRFHYARTALYVTALIVGVTHAFRLARIDVMPMWGAVLLLVTVFWSMVGVARQIGLGRFRWNFGCVILLVVIAGIEIYLQQYLLVAGLATLAAGLLLSVVRTADDASICCGTGLYVLSMLFCLANVFRSNGPLRDLVNWFT